MKKLFFICIVILTGVACYSQDIIEKTNGDVVKCKIDKEDSSTVYVTIRRDSHEISTYIKKSDIKSITYAKEQDQIPNEFDKFSLGIGIGLDYGGIGINTLLYPQKNIGLFFGAGYALAGVGVNGGAKFRFVSDVSKSKVSPYALVMYGYNAAIVIRNDPNKNKLFYGATLGFGLDFKSTSGEGNYWNFAVLLPLRGTEASDYMDELRKSSNIEFDRELIPIGITIGYRIMLD